MLDSVGCGVWCGGWNGKKAFACGCSQKMCYCCRFLLHSNTPHMNRNSVRCTRERKRLPHKQFVCSMAGVLKIMLNACLVRGRRAIWRCCVFFLLICFCSFCHTPLPPWFCVRMANIWCIRIVVVIAFFSLPFIMLVLIAFMQTFRMNMFYLFIDILSLRIGKFR